MKARRIASLSCRLLLGILPSWLPAQAVPQVKVAVLLPKPMGELLAVALRAELPLAAVQVVPFAQVTSRSSEACVVVGASEFELWQLARAGRLLTIEGLGNDFRAGCRDPRGRFVLPWSVRYGVAIPAAEGRARTEPWSITALAVDPQLQDRLAVCAPSIDPTLWLCSMEQRLLRGENETSGFALWTTLDARAGHYEESYPLVLQALRSGAATHAIVPTSMAGELPSTHVLAELADAPVARCGVALISGSGVEAAQLLALRIVLLGTDTSFREQARLIEALPINRPFDGARATDWLAHLENAIKGRGRGVEAMADRLDIIFGILSVMALLLGIYLTRRKSVDAAE
ncbi:hypothetical protein LBMAG49_15210 [Planctomycetota bacterium]|nr:hypothetical protein LBMAG49_15210 [Planctomycetota bacterium]